jgi:hypothetical protein
VVVTRLTSTFEWKRNRNVRDTLERGHWLITQDGTVDVTRRVGTCSITFGAWRFVERILHRWFFWRWLVSSALQMAVVCSAETSLPTYRNKQCGVMPPEHNTETLTLSRTELIADMQNTDWVRSSLPRNRSSISYRASIFVCSKASRPVLGPTPLPIARRRGFCLQMRRPERETNQSPRLVSKTMSGAVPPLPHGA